MLSHSISSCKLVQKWFQPRHILLPPFSNQLVNRLQHFCSIPFEQVCYLGKKCSHLIDLRHLKCFRSKPSMVLWSSFSFAVSLQTASYKRSPNCAFMYFIERELFQEIFSYQWEVHYVWKCMFQHTCLGHFKALSHPQPASNPFLFVLLLVILHTWMLKKKRKKKFWIPDLLLNPPPTYSCIFWQLKKLLSAMKIS